MAQSTGTRELLGFLRGLRAVREYTPDPIDREAIEGMLEVGRWTGSSANRQPTEVIVVQDESVRQRFGEWGARPAASAPLVFLLVTESEAFAFDEGRMAERLLLAAAAHGLGSTVATLKNEGPDAAKKLLGIPADRRAQVVVAVGHADTAARKARPTNPGPPRKPTSAFVHWDRF